MKPSLPIKPEDVPFVCNAIMHYALALAVRIKGDYVSPPAKEVAATVTLPKLTKNGKRRGRPPKKKAPVIVQSVAEAA